MVRGRSSSHILVTSGTALLLATGFKWYEWSCLPHPYHHMPDERLHQLCHTCILGAGSPVPQLTMSVLLCCQGQGALPVLLSAMADEVQNQLFNSYDPQGKFFFLFQTLRGEGQEGGISHDCQVVRPSFPAQALKVSSPETTPTGSALSCLPRRWARNTL